MILSHERIPGAGDEYVKKYELIDSISTIALKWILVNRIEKSQINYKKCLDHICEHLQNIANNFPKYREAITGLDFNFDTG